MGFACLPLTGCDCPDRPSDGAIHVSWMMSQTRAARSLWLGFAMAGWASSVAGQTISSAANQTFVVGATSTTISPITISEAGVKFKKATDVRVMIPAAFNMTWDVSITTATITGSGAGNVSTAVTYEDANKTLVIDVTANMPGTEQIVVSGLKFMNFTATSPASNLGLSVAGPGTPATVTDNRTITIVAPAVMSMVSAANQSFIVNAAPTAVSQITIIEDASPSITAANDIRIDIPATLSMTWDQTDLTATIGGAAAGKISTTVSYQNAGKTLVLNVTANFVAGDQITVAGLSFTSFSSVSPADNLRLVVTGAGGATAATDTRTKTIDGAMISSAANQTFLVGNPATLMSAISVTDGATATITAANDIRVHIPAGFNMTWDASVTTATIAGGAAARVSPTVSYANGNRTLILNVTSNFLNGNQVIVSGLRFTSFSGASAIAHLILEVGNNGLTTGVDDKSLQVVPPTRGASVTPAVVAVSHLPSNGTNYTASFTVSNTGNAFDSYDLLATTPLTPITVITMAGSGVTQGANPDSARVASVAPAGSSVITVTYSVGTAAAGATDTLILRARSVGSPAVYAEGREELTVVRPGISVLKDVTPGGTRPPGTDLTYGVNLTNFGSAAAAGVAVVDTLSSNLMFKVGSIVDNLPSGVAVSHAYSIDGGTTWTYVPASQGCGAPAGFDRCVNRVRWTFTGTLSAVAPDNAARLEFISRIR
jgi:uncharacterized repeat protein (TIGR01451 family)